MSFLCLLRHGESLWNEENRFTGWVDVPLTEKGRQQARDAADLIKAKNLKFDVAYTSELSRAIETANILIDSLGYYIPVIKDSHLNERNYGDLQGLNKQKTAEIYGPEQVRTWRRSYDVRPPNGESLEDTQKRTLPFFQHAILTDLEEGRNVLVVAHGNSLRSIVAYLDSLNKEQILELEIAEGLPIIYEYNESIKKFVDKQILTPLKF